MKRLKTPKGVTTAILTLITIFFWAGFEVYHSLTQKPAPVVAPDIINPIDPTLDTKSLDSLQQRLFFTDDEIGNTQIASSPTPVATLAPVASESASPIPTSSASASPIATP